MLGLPHGAIKAQLAKQFVSLLSDDLGGLKNCARVAHTGKGIHP
jgi:hypothetical protein